MGVKMSVSDFMTTLNYASCNEDWRTEWDALKIKSDDKILCITGSGDRPLNLLYQNPKKIISMDINPVQNNLLRLKMAAMVELPYDEYAVFLGLKDGRNRLISWGTVRKNLSEESRNFWGGYTHILKKGVIYRGRWENHLRKLAFIARIIRVAEIKKLFDFDNIDAQRKFIEMKWDRWWTRKAFDILGSATFSRIFFRDPGFYKYAAKDMNIGRYIFESMKQYLERNLAKESFMLSLMFMGKLSKYDLPPYLDPACVERINKRMDRIEVRTDNILEFMESVENKSFTKYSLSDVPSFLDQKGFERLLDGIVRSGTNGARFCIRQFLTDYKVPDQLEGILLREPELEDRLRIKDRSFAYRFFVGHVKHEE